MSCFAAERCVGRVARPRTEARPSGYWAASGIVWATVAGWENSAVCGAGDFAYVLGALLARP